MIEVYQASHGGVLTLDKHLGEFQSLAELQGDVAASAGIAVENVLLFLQDGKEVKADVLEGLWTRGGYGAGSSSPTPQVMYMFNRETFWSDAEEWAAQFMEDISLPPPLNLSAISDLSQAQAPFAIAHDHLSHLYSLFIAQSAALDIAYSNLAHHLAPLVREFQTFSTRAERELDEEASLIRNAPADLAILPKIGIHESLIRKSEGGRERERSIDSNSGAGGGGESGKTLANYVHAKKMEQVIESCRGTHEEHVNRYNALAQAMDELALQSAAERRGAEERSVQVRLEFEEGLQRIEIAMGQLEVLFNTGASGFSQDLMQLDQAMREDLAALTELKNDYTLDIHLHLRRVAQFQSQIAEVVAPLTTLDGDLRSKGAFPHLSRLHTLPITYATTVVEVVRRKEFAEYLLDVTSRLADVLGRFTGTERERRHKMREDTNSHLPFSIPALDSTLRTNVEVTVSSGKEALSVLNVTRRDVEDLQAWVEEMKIFKPLMDAIDEGADDPIPALQQNLDELIRSMDVPEGYLDRMIEESVLRGSKENGDSAHAFNQAAALEAAEQDRDSLHRQLADLDLAHREDLELLSREHANRTSALQNRQAELQDELMRLRNDLSEEMMARQALSTELGERNREVEDRQRDQEDQSDLVKAIQAEMAQEKDRATDLGVRLQEALLDVDGLKNAEQALIGQVQALQDERSKHLQELSEARIQSQTADGEIARLRAELEESNRQLESARNDRDLALKNQSAEAERLMRDHLAEADGDRAVLEELNVRAKKEMDDLKREMEEKISAVRNAATREANGLKAELSMTKAQFRDAQRRESVLADELAMAKDTAASTSSKEAHQSDVARDAVVLAAKYHEVCQRLMTAIITSSTISGTASALVVRPNSPSMPTATSGTAAKDDLRESVLVKSLASASAFDLVAFGDAVQKTIALVKKWSKSCRHYRELARNKISFRDFAKGDLALFLPTRNATTRPWMAFNISTPHHFVKVPEGNAEAWRTRDSIVARIVSTEEAIAGDAPSSNPFGLAEGLRFYIHQIEEYSPSSSSFKSPRRSVSTDAKTSQMLGSTPLRPPLSEPGPSLLTQSSPTDRSYFPATSPTHETSPPDQSESDPQPAEDGADKSQSPTPPSPVRLSPVQESLHLPSNPPPTANSSPVATLGPSSAPPTAPPPASRIPSRGSAASPSTRDHHPPPLFSPATFGRPASVASSAGSHKTHPAQLSSSPAPAMTITHSSDGDPNSPFADFKRQVARKASATSLKSGPVALENFHRASLEDTRKTPIGSSPLATSPPFGAKPLTGTSDTVEREVSGFAALGTGPTRSVSSGSTTAKSAGNTGTLTRGFSISGLGKTVTRALGSSPSKGSPGNEGAEESKARDMLQKIQGGT